MCGIAWYSLAGVSADAAAALEADARTRLAHRGPDATRVERRGGALWAFHRLAVVGAVDDGGAAGGRGMQPFEGRGGSRMVCNGEVWNYRELWDEQGEPRSDCDAVLALLDAAAAAGGPGAAAASAVAAALARVDGDFALVWQAPEGAGGPGARLVAARDRFGVRPLFWGAGADGEPRAFASEAKALVGAPGVERVRALPPGHAWVELEDARGGRGGALVAFAAPPFAPAPPLEPAPSRPEAAARVRALLDAAVRRRLGHGERPVGVLCSGGIDSAVVTCLAARALAERGGGGARLKVFTMEYAEGLSEDAFYARLLCSRLGVDHTVFRFTRAEAEAAYDAVARALETPDPNTVRAAVPMALLARRIAAETDVRVVLSGEGADELFHGYNYFRLAPDGAAARAEAARLVRQLHAFDVLRADRCMAAAGLELRVPFLDAALVGYVQALPGELPWGGAAGAEKQLLRDAFADERFAALADCRILDRGKERFSDGCGYSYVPHLLEFVNGGRTPVLADKLDAERRRARALFEAAYPGCEELVVAREMPGWAQARCAGGGASCEM